MTPYTVEIGGILHDLGASIVLEGRVAIDALDTADTRFRPVEAPMVVATLTNAGDGVVLNGTVTAAIETDCVRCLEPFVLDISAPLDGFYTTPQKATELPEDQEWEPILTGDTVNIAPAVESALRLELPFAPLHSEDCAGICPVCGCNRNQQQCECDSKAGVEGPFDMLKDLFPQDADEPAE